MSPGHCIAREKKDTKEEEYSNMKRSLKSNSFQTCGRTGNKKQTVKGQRKVCPNFLPLSVAPRGAERNKYIQRGMGSGYT